MERQRPPSAVTNRKEEAGYTVWLVWLWCGSGRVGGQTHRHGTQTRVRDRGVPQALEKEPGFPKWG